MMRFVERLKDNKELIAMIHLDALPGTPGNRLPPAQIIKNAVDEARLYQKHSIRTVMIENMHDIPYVKHAGPEIVGIMSVIGKEIKALGLFCGIQILAGCNREAMGAAYTAGMDFVRVEGYVFSHIGDEGIFESCAGDLLRYRKTIGAEHISVFTDIKKKHSAHAITADVNLKQTADAARFFLADGVIITGSVTGAPVDPAELQSLAGIPIPKIIGSGITDRNLSVYWKHADAFIVGSYLKKDGSWYNPPDPHRIDTLLRAFQKLS